jgi:hypothetical protein
MKMIKKRLREFYDRFLSLRGEPRTMALGMAVGVFIGVTPTIPFHTALIVLCGLICKCNLTAAYLGSWLISNPVTIPVLYFSQYHLGRRLIGISDVHPVLIEPSLQGVMAMGWQVILPLLTGGVVMAPFFAIPAYFLTYRMALKLRSGQRS